jgi:hypothetical protein
MWVALAAIATVNGSYGEISKGVKDALDTLHRQPRHDPVDNTTTGAELIAAAKSRQPPCATADAIPACLPHIPNVGMDAVPSTFGGVDFYEDVTHGDGLPMKACGKSSKLAFLHPAKTAGDTVLWTLYGTNPYYLYRSPINVSLTYFHMWNPEEIGTDMTGERRSFTHYLINMRDPLSRLRSSFNYMPTAEIERCYPLPDDGQGAFNAFAESLNSSTACGEWARWAMRSPKASGLMQASMLRQGLTLYTANGLMRDLRKPGVQAYITRLESLDADMAGMFDWLCLPPNPTYIEDHGGVVELRSNDTYVSPFAFENLMAELEDEYDAWRQLEKLAVNGDESLVDAALANNQEQYGAPLGKRSVKHPRGAHDTLVRGAPNALMA